MINIVLVEPLIPQNTGNIMRTCVALNMKLHLIKPLGFEMDEKYLKRSALDYFRKTDYTIYDDINDFFNKTLGGIYYFYTRYGKKPYTKANYKISCKKEVYLIFGKETTGIDKEILKEHLNNCYRIPTTEDVRSINLSNAVAVVAFFASYKNNFKNMSKFEPGNLKGKNYLKK